MTYTYLDTVTAGATGVTWGAPWPRGELQPGEGVALQRADGSVIPTQTWPLAYWPDGSVKWLGCAAVLTAEDGTEFELAKGESPAPAQALTITQPGIEIIRVADTGVMQVEVGDRGRYIVQQITRNGRTIGGGVELTMLLEQRRCTDIMESREREQFAGIIESLTVEQAGPVRGLIKLEGRYRGESSGREMLPFTVRLEMYAGCDSVRVIHSFVFDGDADEDHIAGLGVRAHVPLQEGVHNRHVRVLGEDGKGVWSEPVRLLPYEKHRATPAQAVQLRGEPVEAPPDGGLLPAWSDFQLLQDSCDHASLRKRQNAACSWVTAEHCRRAPGVMSVSEPGGGLAMGLRDFWQACPAAVELTGATGTETRLTGWWWAPDAEPMDLRHYGDFMHTYDPARHVWHYDQGGRAWDNTELGSDIWPWYNFLRTGRSDWFRFAEAMTRHVSEVDVFHLGPWTGQGSRHGVVHWGCPCKEPRVSQAGAKRFYHYLTADERCRDLLDEAAETADQFKATNVPADKYMARIGPTWAAWSANWMCAWERTGDTRWRDRILTGLEGILRAPFKLMQGDPFDYDPATGEMSFVQNPTDGSTQSNALALTMGGAEAWMELAGLLDHAPFSDALAEWGATYALDEAEREALPSELQQRTWRLGWAYARLMAWAGTHRNDPELKRRAWTVLLGPGPGEPGTGPGLWVDEFKEAPPALSAEPWQDTSLKTNHVAAGSLNLIACLALAADELTVPE